MLAEHTAERLSPERALGKANACLLEARRSLADAKVGSARAFREASDADDFTVRSRIAYERARADSRRCGLALRRWQRQADDAKLMMRQAYELVARLEGLERSTVIDLTLNQEVESTG